MSEMSERAAKAAREVARNMGAYFDDYVAAEIARAAIEAMREPTREMIEAGAKGSGEDSDCVARGAWDAMIDAALKVTEPAE